MEFHIICEVTIVNRLHFGSLNPRRGDGMETRVCTTAMSYYQKGTQRPNPISRKIIIERHLEVQAPREKA
jgi:hypothetical protein